MGWHGPVTGTSCWERGNTGGAWTGSSCWERGNTGAWSGGYWIGTGLRGEHGWSGLGQGGQLGRRERPRKDWALGFGGAGGLAGVVGVPGLGVPGFMGTSRASEPVGAGSGLGDAGFAVNRVGTESWQLPSHCPWLQRAASKTVVVLATKLVVDVISGVSGFS